MPASLLNLIVQVRRHSAVLKQLRFHLHYHCETILLFTLADLKTIFIPISAFACATAPIQSSIRLLPAWTWIWLHQFMCNVSNQARGGAEDAVNKPWRPIPSGRITESQAVILRWASVTLCIMFSTALGADMIFPTVGLFLTTYLYDEGGLSSHYIGKNFCNIGGYTTFEVGATKLMGVSRVMDGVSSTAVYISGALISTTIQAQDFVDVDGDKMLGRVTFPIYAPELSRAAILLAVPGWAMFLSWFWSIGPVCATVFIMLGCAVGARFYLKRSTTSDKFSYILYNVWLTAAHILPLNARISAFAF